ncbi:tyrosine-protein phosphatase Lar-like isoform X3 [Argiope bruennichi]|uniref:tyrosine-protein phosphatase Lar-like isoform X3 n=1 Tax=Argiope bruennichi TaxID=94029 RepID=UPI0024945EF7|nr:tyrosine-protein phosphatase Lar-like isoform X3 [Argiope bruennichi]
MNPLVFKMSFYRLSVIFFLLVSECFHICISDGDYSQREYVKFLKHPPRIETAPRNQTVLNNGVASFVCAAVGNPKPQIEWRKNGKRVTTQRYTVQEMPNGSVLRIDPVKAGRDDATYECMAENGVGEPVRALATLTVLAEDQIPPGFPQFTMQPQIQGVEMGRNALLPCRAEGTPQPTIRWLKSYIPVDMSDPRYSLVQGSSLQIMETEEDDQGSYECVADNEKGTAVSGPATLYVRVRRVPPYFSIPPEELYEVMPGSNLNITCVAVGSPMPYVKWKKGLMDITSEHDMPIGKNVLQLVDVRESANYTCVAASKLGSIEAVAQVVVQGRALPRPPTRVQISDVTASSVRIAWSYDIGSENIIYYVIQYKPRQTNQDYSEISGINTMFYTIRDLTPYTEYEFYVIAVNAIGRGSPSAPAVITTGETEPGSAPRNVQATPLSTSTVVVQWDPPKEPNGQVTGYKVYYTLNPHSPTQTWMSQIVDNNQLTTISDLKTHAIYTMRVQAFTSRGPGPLSAPIQVKTQLGVPSQPTNLRATPASATTVQLSWTRPTHTGENIIGYELYWNDTFTQHEYHREIPDVESYTLGELYPDTLYFVWVAAKSKRGEGAATPPVHVRTEQYAPSSPPLEVTGVTLNSRSLRISWEPPPKNHWNGVLKFYKVLYLKADKPPVPASANTKIVDAKDTHVVLDKLNTWTEYRVWVLAGTEAGEGPLSEAIVLRTDEGVPGMPRDVEVRSLNSTTVNVRWKAPANRDRNGLIRGYQIHAQEMNREGDLVNEGMRYDVAEEEAEEYNVTGLQPATNYSIQVAAVTRKGDGARSRAVTVETQGGVPTRPEMTLQLTQEEPTPVVQVQWSRPAHIYGQLLSYRLRYGKVNGTDLEVMDINPLDHHTSVRNLDRGTKYEFRLSGRNALGWGQEFVTYLETPEGVPTAPPQNLTHNLQSPTTVVISWDPPVAQYRNGKILHYGVQFHKALESKAPERNTTASRLVFSALDENTEYVYRVRAYTAKGPGPWSSPATVHTPGDVPTAPTNVQAMATSETTVLVWWDQVPYFLDILGYKVLYTLTTVEDLEEWHEKEVPLTWSAELTGLDTHAMYAIRVAAATRQGLGRLSELITVRVTPTDVPTLLRAQEVTTHSMLLTWKAPSKLDPIKYKISYSAHKEFYDSHGLLQELPIPPQDEIVDAMTTELRVDNLMPFTSYQVNITAIPHDETFRPPAKITVTTAMAAPKPMVKPDSFGVHNNMEITVVLPQASEEYGPISHYFLVVVPEQFATKEPDDFTIEELTATKPDQTGPFIAAKFLRRTMPENFSLGDGKMYMGFVNRHLLHGVRYKVFVRAVVDTPHKSLYTSSPFSDSLSLDMAAAPGHPVLVGSGGIWDKTDRPDISEIDGSSEEAGVIWIVAPVLLLLIIITFIVVLVLLRRRYTLVFSRRRQLAKTPAGETTMKLLMNVADREMVAHPTDPVEIRRINYQTPAMINHPPIPVSELANHIERLKANDNVLFSQEYESIEPGQQFTWENSNLEINKPKNRYANVIAYDHSRVVLQPLDGIPGSDYINANYCDGYRKPKAYIATQGPLPETFCDFWRMVWEQRSATIVMMTKLEERTRIKCDQYWPSRGTETYGVMYVKYTEVSELASYCIRTFHLQRVGFPETREVRQFQFTAWPDHGVPEHPTAFLMFLRRVQAMNPMDAGPIVVHCSAGVGRTGCFIVIDSMLERLKHETTVDIYGHVTCLRAQRNYMVQTEDQYVFAHDSVLEAVVAGVTEVPARSLYTHINQLMQVIPGENTTGMELEFKKLSMLNNSKSVKFVSANLPVNKFKNRLMNILPYESTRVCLQPIRGVDGSDYINANYIDGYRYKNAYIATQGPLAETTEDFWRMLWEHNSNIVVMLTKLKELGREKCHQYWPNERSQRYLYYVVDPITEYNMPLYILREFKVTDARDGQSRTIRQFHFTDWPEQGVPKSGEGFIDFIGQVHKTKEQFGQEGPITVHCSAGVGRTGVFITLSIVLERMQYEGVVDIFQSIRILRTQRPGMVQTEDQYQFCYRAALEYLGSFDNYAN